MSIPSGIGGTCSPDNNTYTVTHKIATTTPGLYFIQYEYSVDAKSTVLFTIQKFSDSTKVPNEGDTGTDVCTNLPNYSSVSSGGAWVMIDVRNDISTGTIGSNLTYDQMSSDSDIMTMLKSLKVE
jgi:hypothetical protein